MLKETLISGCYAVLVWQISSIRGGTGFLHLQGRKLTSVSTFGGEIGRAHV